MAGKIMDNSRATKAERGAESYPTPPEAVLALMGVEALPSALMQRTTNHGFEAAALDGNILYAFMQSPIDNPDRADDANVPEYGPVP